MDKSNDEKAQAVVSERLRALVMATDDRESNLCLTPQEVDDLVNKLLLCVRNVGKDQPIDPDANPEIKNILQNFWQVHDAFIEKIIVDLPAENKSRYDIKALRDAVKPHIQSCVCLNRTPENFALKVEEVIRNYLLDGELVEVLKGNLSSPNSPQLIDAIQKYLKKVALGKLRCEVGEVDDLIQTTWVRLLEKLDGFHFLSRFRVWAVTILFQTYCDDVRHQKSKKAGGRFKKVSLFTPVENDDSGFTIGETLPTPELDPEREWLFNSLFDLVSAHLEQYQSELYKKIGGEGILRQDKVEDIAKELNLPAQKVSAILFKIRQKLRQDPNIRPAK